MNADVKKRWLEALRSGEYKQVEDYLAVEDQGFCCLGVLCEIALQDGVVTKSNDGTRPNVPEYLGPDEEEGWDTELPGAVVAWADLPDNNPDVVVLAEDGWSRNTTLSGLNDELKWDFKKIADIIEEQL